MSNRISQIISWLVLLASMGMLAIGLFAESHRSQKVVAGGSSQLYPCTITSNHDGDTVHCAVIRGPWGMALAEEDVRLLGFDAWEVSKVRRTRDVTDGEVIKGKRARDDLAALIGAADSAYLRAPTSGKQRDLYGRPLGWLVLKEPDGSQLDIAKWMREHDYDRDVDSRGKPRSGTPSLDKDGAAP